MLTQIGLGVLAYLIAVFPLAYIWHLVIFKERFEAMGYFGRTEPIVALGFLAILFQGVVISMLFHQFRGTGNVFGEAAKIIVPLMALIWSSQVIAHAAKFEVRIAPFLLLETAYFALQAVLVAVAMAIAYRLAGY